MDATDFRFVPEDIENPTHIRMSDLLSKADFATKTRNGIRLIQYLGTNDLYGAASLQLNTSASYTSPIPPAAMKRMILKRPARSSPARNCSEPRPGFKRKPDTAGAKRKFPALRSSARSLSTSARNVGSAQFRSKNAGISSEASSCAAWNNVLTASQFSGEISMTA